MKGIIFTSLESMVTEQLGLKVWDKILNAVDPESGGAYTTGGSYSDEELYSIVAELSKISGTEVDDLLRAFGEYTLPALSKAFPDFFKYETPEEFLMAIDEVIHFEVRKLYLDAKTPMVKVEMKEDGELDLIYSSDRKLCSLTEGFLKGTSIVYEQPVNFEKVSCQRSGDSNCRYHLKIG